MKQIDLPNTTGASNARQTKQNTVIKTEKKERTQQEIL